jgi:S-adenosylmethionine hydrolase
VLGHVLAEHFDPERASPGVVPVPHQCAAYRLTNQDYWLSPVSNTFHGRDVFAPVAAHLSLGVLPQAVGEPLSGLVWRATSRPTRDGNRITGEVVYADHFGNLITNVPQSLLRGAARVAVEIRGHRIERLGRTFHDNPGPGSLGALALVGSNGFLEIAVADGNARDALGVGPGEPVLLTLESGG